MKKDIPITSVLGLTQSELAMILNVSRPLVTLYEQGKRDLPLPAQQLLAKMLAHMKSAQATTKTTVPQNQYLQHVEKLSRENEFQRLSTQRKIAALEKKRIKAERLSHLALFFESETKPESHNENTADNLMPATKNNTFQQVLKRSVGNSPDGNTFELMKLKVKLGILESERDYLMTLQKKSV